MVVEDVDASVATLFEGEAEPKPKPEPEAAAMAPNYGLMTGPGRRPGEPFWLRTRSSETAVGPARRAYGEGVATAEEEFRVRRLHA